MGWILVYAGIIVGVVWGSVWVIKCLDGFRWYLNKKEWCSVGVYCLSVSLLLQRVMQTALLQDRKNIGSTMISLAVVAGCLCFACLTDSRCCLVYEFTWWIAGGAAVLLMLERYAPGDIGWNVPYIGVIRNLTELCLFIVLQELFFSRFYGRADCHAFVICGLVECALGLGMMGYLFHMLWAFLCLAVVQLFRGNIGMRGNLKQPVAFLPYITFSFWVLLFWEKNVILERISEINL